MTIPTNSDIIKAQRVCMAIELIEIEPALSDQPDLVRALREERQIIHVRLHARPQDGAAIRAATHEAIRVAEMWGVTLLVESVLTRTINRCIAEGSPVITEQPPLVE